MFKIWIKRKCKQPRPLFLHLTLQLALCIGAGSVLLTSAKPRLICWTARWRSDSSLQRTHFHCSMLGIAHGDLRLVCGCLAMETPFMKLLTNSYCADVASRGSLELGSESFKLGQRFYIPYKLQHAAVLFCELLWLTTSRLSRCCSYMFPLHNYSTDSWLGQL